MAKEEAKAETPSSSADSGIQVADKKGHGFIPVWLKEALHNKRQWKNWFRSMVTTLAMMVLMLDSTTLKALGAAAFFGLIASQMLPPSMPLSIYFFAIVTMGLGMLIGWAWGCAAWASALTVRSASRLAQQQQTAAAGYDPNVSTALQYQASMFEGAFLDPASSAVFGVFLFLGAYAFGWLRAKNPKMTLVSIFATIILDLMCSFGPLIPLKQFTIAEQLLKPAAVFMACGVVATIVFFPQSLNHLLLSSLVHKALNPLQQLLALQDDILATKPSDHERWSALAQNCYDLRAEFVEAQSGLDGQAKMLQLEVTRGRISPGQLGELVARTRELGARAFGLASFVLMVEERHQGMKMFNEKPLPHHTSTTRAVVEHTNQHEKASRRALEDLMPELDESTRELRQAAKAGLESVSQYLDMINNHRWKRTPKDAPTIESRQETLKNLEDALEEYRKSKHFNILNGFQDLFDPVTGKLKPTTEKYLASQVRGLFRCFTFTSGLISFSKCLVEYIQFVLELEHGNPKNKLQFPGKFVAAAVENVTDSTQDSAQFDYSVQDDLADNGSQDDDSRTIKDEDLPKGARKKKTYRRDPDARAPTNRFQKVGRAIMHIGRGLSGPNGIYAFKYGFISIALWIPAVTHHSAKFCYENRGLWALIMAQTGMGIYAGESIYNFVTRMSATIIGAVLGMVVWYIGAQKGTGNPYGLAAATMVFIGPFLFIRLAAPMKSMSFWLMTAVTIVFVVGYSWVDENIAQTANQGSGATLSGRRALLVIIGFTGSFVVSVFPKPTSAKKLVRQGLSKNIAALGELFGLEVTAFERSRDEAEANVKERRERYRTHFLAIFGRIQSLKARIGFASLEPNIRGRWPKEDYLALLKTQGQMLSASAVVSSAYSQLNAEWIQRLTEQSDVMNPSFIADCFSLFALLRHSLRVGAALPPTIPIFERLMFYRTTADVRTAYHASRSQINLNSRSNLNLNGGNTNLDTDALSGLHLSVPQPDGSRASTRPSTPGSGASGYATPGSIASSINGGDNDGASFTGDSQLLDMDIAVFDTFRHALTWQNCHDEQFPIFATAILALTHIVSGLNQMHRTILDLVGEVELDGFDSAAERWAKQDEDV